MKIAFCLPALLLVASLAGDVQAETPTAAKRRQLATAITEGIRLLDNQEHAAFLTEYTEPAVYADVISRISEEDFLAVFVEGVAADTKAAFQACQAMVPLMSENDTRATYIFISFNQQLVLDKVEFVKVGDYWYLDR